MFTEPDPSSDNESPEFMEEVFDLYRHRKVNPDNLSAKERKQYLKWLETWRD